MKRILMALLIPALVWTAGESRAGQTFTVNEDTLLFSQPGSLVRIVEDGVSGSTFLAFEFEQLIQLYAERVDGSDVWEVFDGRQFLCRAWAMEVGNTWRFLDDEDTGEQRNAQVVSSGIVNVAAGSFTAWRVDISRESTPGIVQQSIWFAGGTGIVKQVDRIGGAVVANSELQTSDVTGVGFFPLVIGNHWEYASQTVPAATRSIGTFKFRY